MQNNPRYNSMTSHNIKGTVAESIPDTQKISKVVLGVKIQLTYLSLLAGLMVVLMFTTPLLSLAQQKNPTVVKAVTEGELNATARTNSSTWFILGFIGGPITVLVAASRKPPPPVDLLLGKPPGYVEAFTEAYETKIRNLRLRYATIGCVTGITFGALYGAYNYGYNKGHDNGFRDGYDAGYDDYRAGYSY